ncbi:unnamed protein product [Rangifer tarandus platyrhynchus]|uniref:Uncharacterized protein n=1 Tax=Rangifer tarandus platyrhynchus TaxID=3082113 RepID=A0ABN8ZM28_RANTA|nr:unnamed protein product [Rangifer tarandus platyrhynchus]
MSRTWFWAADAHPPPLRSYPVLSVHVAYTDGNNFFQLLGQVGEACSRPCEGAFLSLSLSLSLSLACSSSRSPPVSAAGSLSPFLSPLTAAVLNPCLPPWMRSCL